MEYFWSQPILIDGGKGITDISSQSEKIIGGRGDFAKNQIQSILCFPSDDGIYNLVRVTVESYADEFELKIQVKGGGLFHRF